MTTLFITATGTETGKTYVAAGLIKALMAKGVTVRALKPVITGFSPETLQESDTAILIRALGQEANEATIAACSPWRFAEPLSPDMAAKREDREIDFDELLAFCAAAAQGPEDVLLCEGIGGAMVPLNDRHTVLDLMVNLGWPALIIAGSYLGTLSHTLTTVKAVQSRGVEIAGIVVDESEESPVPVAETVEVLSRFLPGLNIAAVSRGAEPEAVLAALSEMTGF